MKKTYIAPTTEFEVVMSTSMMAVSLPADKGTEGDVADVKLESADWDMEW